MLVLADHLIPAYACPPLFWKALLHQAFNTLRPRQNGHHFADNIFKWIFLNENVWIPIKISLKLVPQGPINNIPALVEIMAWRRPGDKPLSGPMMVRLLTHICVTRPQWVNCPIVQGGTDAEQFLMGIQHHVGISCPSPPQHMPVQHCFERHYSTKHLRPFLPSPVPSLI